MKTREVTKKQETESNTQVEIEKQSSSESIELEYAGTSLNMTAMPPAGHPPANHHTELVQRARKSNPVYSQQLFHHLQRNHGNYYVQRIVELSHKGDKPTEVDQDIEQTIQSKRGGGNAMDGDVRQQMEGGFGRNFSGVRIHTDSDADALNKNLNARAFTTGTDVFFRSGEYRPGSSSGRELLAHELTHVVQQGGSKIRRKNEADEDDQIENIESGIQTKLILGQPNDKYEQEADAVAQQIMRQEEEAPKELQLKPAAVLLRREEEESEDPQLKSTADLMRQEDENNTQIEEETVTASTEFREEGWDEVNEPGIVYQEAGANLRDKPLPEDQGSVVIDHLKQNTKVFTLKHDKKNKWLAVATVGEKGGGQFGYVADWLIWGKLPEPEVNVYKIKKGDHPLKIAAREYPEFNVWGEDQRYVVNALVYVNNTTENNGTGEPGLRKRDMDINEPWFTATANKDVYIWLPSSSFLKSMYEKVAEKGGGTGSISADIWRTVKKGLEVLAYGAAFIGGLVHGFVKSIVDAIVGIATMVIDLLVSIFTLNVFSDAKELWDTISKLTWEDIKEAFGAWTDKWRAKLESSSPWVAGHAHGYLTGYIMAEAAMLLIGAGTIQALKGAKWATKFAQAIKATKAAQKLAKGIDKARKAGGKAKEIIDKVGTGLMGTGKKIPGKRALVLAFRRGIKIKKVAVVSLRRLRQTLGRAGVGHKKYKLVMASKSELKALKEFGDNVDNIFGWVSRDGAGRVITDFRGRPIITFTKKGLSSIEEAVKTFGHEAQHIKDFARGAKEISEVVAELAGEELWLVVSKKLKKMKLR